MPWLVSKMFLKTSFLLQAILGTAFMIRAPWLWAKKHLSNFIFVLFWPLLAHHCTSPCCIALHCTSLYCPKLHFTSLHSTVISLISFHLTSLHYTAPNFTSPNWRTLHFTTQLLTFFVLARTAVIQISCALTGQLYSHRPTLLELLNADFLVRARFLTSQDVWII